MKIIVTHHPFDVPAGSQDHDIVGRARLAIQTFAACGGSPADRPFACELSRAYCHALQAWRLLGADRPGWHGHLNRVRYEANTFNVIRIA